jgi:DNA-binding phage protein
MRAGGMTHVAAAGALGVSRQALTRALELLDPGPQP